MTRLHDVVIVGGGPSGLAAADALRRQGVSDVVLIEREGAIGGVPRHCGHRVFGLHEFHRLLTGPEYSRRLANLADGVAVRVRTTALRLEPGGHVSIVGANGPERISARAILLATGARETPRPPRLVSGGRPWGIVTTGALQQFVYLERLRPFGRAVIIGSELVSFSALLTMRHARIRPIAIIEDSPRLIAPKPFRLLARLLFGAPVMTNTSVLEIVGTERVEGLTVKRAGRRLVFACDGVVFTGKFVPEATLAEASGLMVDHGTKGPIVDQDGRCSWPEVFCAGNGLRGVEGAGWCFEEGRAAARSIVAYLAGALPKPDNVVPVTAHGALRYVYPQRLSLSPGPGRAVRLYARATKEMRGTLSISVEGRAVWKQRIRALPERRIDIPMPPLSQLGTPRSLCVELVET